MSETTEAKKPPATDLVAFRQEMRGLSAKKRLDLILERPDVMRVVRSLPVQDVFTTLKEVGPSDALELVELLHPRQVQGIVDLDAWRGDRLDPRTMGDWLEILFAANPAKAVTQVKGLDVELLTLLFKMHTRIYDLSAEEDAPEDNPPVHSITPDNHYLIVYDAADGRISHYLKTTVERLFGIDIPFITRLIESVRWDLPSSLEEESFRWRNNRLADLGFLPPGEAQEVFAWTDPDKVLEGAPERYEVAKPAEHEDVHSTDLSTSVLLPEDLFTGGAGLFGEAVAHLDEAAQQRVSSELVMMGNRLHVATGGDVGDPEALRATVARVADTVGIALAYLARGDAAKLQEPLLRLPLLRIFQAGHALPVRVSRGLRARLRDEDSGLAGDGLLRLDAPLRETVAGLLRPQPLLFGGLMDAARSDFVHFSTLPQLAAATQAASEAAFRAELMQRGLGGDDETLGEVGIRDASTGPSHGALVATWLCHGLLGDPEGFTPLDDAQLAAIAKKLEGDDKKLPRAEVATALKALAAAARAIAPLAGAPDAEEAEARAEAFGELALEVVEAELGALDADSVDGRFVRALYTRGWMEEQAEKAADESADGDESTDGEDSDDKEESDA
jgi:hypothetical protein